MSRKLRNSTTDPGGRINGLNTTNTAIINAMIPMRMFNALYHVGVTLFGEDVTV
jgi:hypothetical protein